MELLRRWRRLAIELRVGFEAVAATGCRAGRSDDRTASDQEAPFFDFVDFLVCSCVVSGNWSCLV